MTTRRERDPFANFGPERCVIYLRISQDRTGEQLGIERQESDCRALAQRLGMSVQHVCRDNDLSATSGKLRPDFEAMLATRPAAIISWHQDRLLRLTSDLEKVIDLGVPVHFVTSGNLDLSTPAGRAVARTVAAWSQYETEQKAIRQEASNRQRAERGYWQFSLRPYGYRRVNGEIVTIEDEAEVVREGYRRVIAGDSYRSIAADWNSRGIKPLKGDRWMPARVQRLLENSHYGGVVTYKGEELPDVEPQWKPLIDRRTWSDFVELKLNRKKKRSWAVTPKYLLSGLLVCGVCGGSVFTQKRHERVEGPTATNHDGTKRRTRVNDLSRPKVLYYTCFERFCVSARAEAVDEFVEQAVLGRVSDKKVRRALQKLPNTAPVQEEIADLRRRRNHLTELVSDGLIARREAREKLTRIAERLDLAQARLAAMRRESPLSDLALARSIPTHWERLSVLEKRRIIDDAGMRLTLLRAPRGRRPRGEDGKPVSEAALTRSRVHVEWRDPVEM